MLLCRVVPSMWARQAAVRSTNFHQVFMYQSTSGLFQGLKNPPIFGPLRYTQHWHVFESDKSFDAISRVRIGYVSETKKGRI